MELTSLVRAAKGSREQQVDWVTGDSMESVPPAGTSPGKGKQFQGKGPRALQPLRPLMVPGQRDRAGGHRDHRDTALLSPSLQHQGIFPNWKNKKAQAKTVINTRANSEEFGQSQGSAASTRSSTASLEVTGSTGGITAPHPTPNLLPAQSRGTRGLCIPPSLGSSKFFPNHLPTHKTFCAPLICVISLS